jgi:hypothetical protein
MGPARTTRLEQFLQKSTGFCEKNLFQRFDFTRLLVAQTIPSRDKRARATKRKIPTAHSMVLRLNASCGPWFRGWAIFQAGGASRRHQAPVFGMEAQGSRGGSAPPRCKSSIDMPSGDRTKAMWPSRGGRLIVTPPACKRSQVA